MTSSVVTGIVILIGYLVLMSAIGIISAKFSKQTAEDFFLASRGVGTIFIFFTLFTTNISAAAYLGWPGQAYFTGVGFFGYIATTTTFAALSFYIIGLRVRYLGQKFGHVTPAEVFAKRYESKVVGLLYFLIFAFFTIPYAAIQPIGAIRILQGMSGGVIQPWVAVLIAVFFVCFYTFLGGMRGVVWTQFAQGILMIGLVIGAFVMVVVKMGGFNLVTAQLLSANPELLGRQSFSLPNWISFGLIIGLGVPMFPQMFINYFAAKNSASLKTSMTIYPLAMIAIYIPIIFLAVYGRIGVPGLADPKQAEAIIPMLLTQYYPLWVASLMLTAPFSALLSTVAAQLITISSMFTRDVYLRYINPNASPRRQWVVGRLFVLFMAVAAIIIALNPPGSIFQIINWAFTGYAGLFPATIAGLYWKRSTAAGIIASIVGGEAVLLGFATKILPKSLLLGFEPILGVIIVAVVMLGVVSYLTKPRAVEAKTAREYYAALDTIFGIQG